MPTLDAFLVGGERSVRNKNLALPTVTEPKWRIATIMTRTDAHRLTIPASIYQRWPWLSRVRRVRVWGRELDDRVIVIVEFFKPPALLDYRRRRRLAVFLMYEFSVKPAELIDVAENIWMLTPEDRKAIEDLIVDLIDVHGQG